ncbi:hypothetical protein M0R72_00720 [Candidatus Pacearchaeota archaeon]|jgi:hypothetical protein|nr:hypothetical protein [Candidatus Pacearchaeota archaeon]
MSVDLPTTEHATAQELAVWCSDVQLARAITYLELVHLKQIQPGPEIEKLLGEDSLLTWNEWEVDAVQRRISLALYIKRTLKVDRRKASYPITRIIHNCVECHRGEVLSSYNTRR